MDRKKIVIAAGIIVILGFLVILLFGNRNDTVVERPADFPVGTTDIRPTEQIELLGIQVSENQIIELRDPRTLESTTDMGSGMYSVTTLENVTDKPFDIIFNEANASFAIGLTKEPVSQARYEAERYLMQSLGLSEDEMCALNIFVGVPFAVNEFLAGKNLGVSFCKGAYPLE